MSSISIQFHATPDELAEFVNKISFGFDIHVIGMSFPPFQAVELFGKHIEEAIRNGTFWRIAFTEFAPNLPVETQKEFGEKNPKSLYLDVGRLTANGLGESWLACRTIDVQIPVAWKRVQAELRSITKSGATAMHPDGASIRVRNHRFTPGAKLLNDNGVPMLPIAGTTMLKLGTPK
ncbi:MAG TPA: hypothetical protein VFV96_07840 [Verrucomicrobiae bacterium]|nr:hypothetical protein [Verrucomicrobiae bacterium]